MAVHITEDLVRHIARLARLKLTDEEVSRYGRQLDDILSYVGQLDEIDTGDIEPTVHPLAVTNVLREDVPRPSLGAETALANAPDAAGGYFKVPRVLDQREA